MSQVQALPVPPVSPPPVHCRTAGRADPCPVQVTSWLEPTAVNVEFLYNEGLRLLRRGPAAIRREDPRDDSRIALFRARRADEVSCFCSACHVVFVEFRRPGVALRCPCGSDRVSVSKFL